jgi:hypothetical protein
MLQNNNPVKVKKYATITNLMRTQHASSADLWNSFHADRQMMAE